MARKATHVGTCQVCGRVQKLPGGQLSLHGYTKRWGFFSGTCPGASHLPFEQSKALVEGAIAGAEATIARLLAEASALRAPATSPECWARFFRAATWQHRQSGYEWRQCRVVSIEHNAIRVERERPTYESGTALKTTAEVPVPSEPGSTLRLPVRLTSLEHAATIANARYAASLEAEVPNYARYIGWQRERIANWMPQPLTPVAEAPATPEA